MRTDAGRQSDAITDFPTMREPSDYAENQVGSAV
jgi:hypothetical protein